MVKRMSSLLLAGVFVFSVYGCGNQEQQQGQAPGAGGQPQGELAIPQKGEEAVVTVPDEVKKSWKAVQIKVVSKKDNSVKEYTVALGGETAIPGSKLTVKAAEFLPSFVMQGLNITSASNEPNNPAAKVVISEGGVEVFSGWLFQKFPETHAFVHEAFAITLIGGVKS